MLFKLLRIVAIAIVTVLLLAVAGVVVPKPLWSRPASAPATHRLLVLSNPIHTDIAIPVDDALRVQFGFLRNAGLDVDLDGVRYLVFGWGGRAFYTETPTWADLKAIPVLKSLTLDASVMHVELAADIAPDSPYATAIDIDQDGYERMLHAIRQSFADGTGGPVSLPGYGAYDVFFEAHGYFNAIAGCNTWTATMLGQAGVSTGWWTPMPWMLRLALRLHNGGKVVAR